MWRAMKELGLNMESRQAGLLAVKEAKRHGVSQESGSGCATTSLSIATFRGCRTISLFLYYLHT